MSDKNVKSLPSSNASFAKKQFLSTSSTSSHLTDANFDETRKKWEKIENFYNFPLTIFGFVYGELCPRTGLYPIVGAVKPAGAGLYRCVRYIERPKLNKKK